MVMRYYGNGGADCQYGAGVVARVTTNNERGYAMPEEADNACTGLIGALNAWLNALSTNPTVPFSRFYGGVMADGSRYVPVLAKDAPMKSAGYESVVAADGLVFGSISFKEGE